MYIHKYQTAVAWETEFILANSKYYKRIFSVYSLVKFKNEILAHPVNNTFEI